MIIKNLRILAVLVFIASGLYAPGCASAGITAPVDNVPDAVEFAFLRKLYDSLGGLSWTRKAYWPTAGNWPASATSEQFDTWYGITVTNGDISKIELSNNKLTGKIPRNVGDLQALEVFNLYRSPGITGSIPVSIGTINTLQEINLGTCHLSGGIPAGIFNLPVLHTFDVSINDLTGSVPSTVGNAGATLKILSLGQNLLTGDIPSSVNSLVHLQILNLKNNKLSGNIPVDIGLFMELQELQLSTNQLTGSIPASWDNLKQLKILYLFGNQLTGAIPSSVGGLENLVELSLCTNMLTGSIPRSLGNLRKLQYLNLYENQLAGPIPSEVGNLTELLRLELHTNQLSGAIPSSLGNLVKLERLSLHENKLTGTIPSSIANIPTLDIVNLSFNNLSGTIPSFLGELSTLRSLYLNNNQFSGIVPASLGNLENLEYLGLNSNQLSGPVPSEFSDLSHLKVLYLYNNQFTGPLPANLFASMTEITAIDINSNFFSGEFPASIAACTSLTSLKAHRNLFTLLPASILTMPVLSTANFNTNELTTTPDFSTHINKKRLTLVVSYNRLDFSSLIPLKNVSIKEVQLSPQNNIRDVTHISPEIGAVLTIPARPLSTDSTMTWEKQQTNGTWSNVNSLNEDVTLATFRRTTFAATDEGIYRWRMTNTVVTGVTLLSDPIRVETLMKTVLGELSFQYRYDGRKRMIKKKVPGADWVYMVYDNRDRLVLTQDGNQRAKSTPEWTFTKYDALNRPVTTGVYRDAVNKTQEAMQTAVTSYYAPNPLPSTKALYESFTGTGTTHGYDNKSFPVVNVANDYLTVTYYDNYTFQSLTPTPANLNYDASQLPASGGDKAQEPSAFGAVKGLVTGTKVKNLETAAWLWTVNHYDDRYRAIQTIATNHKGGRDKITNVYDFVGKVLRTKTTHTVSGAATRNIVRRFDYDHAGRLLNVWHQAGATQPVLLAKNEYNELGQLITKRLHSMEPPATPDNQRTFRQSMEYGYNIRGWLTGMNDPDGTDALFSMALQYNTPTAKGGPAQYDGNISEILWRSAGGAKQSYGYYYDTLSRIKEARYFNHADPGQDTRYDEKIGGMGLKGYDLNGNILTLQRRGRLGENTYGLMDNLKYTYQGNQLTKVDDAVPLTSLENGFKELQKTTGEYTYDQNGNMLIDKNKGITAIEYNHLNLPRKVSKSGTEYIIYTYDATGRKLSQQVFGTTAKVTDYLGEFVYENNGLIFINHEEGRIIPGVTDEYQYHVKDHLGNVRLTFTTKEETETATATLEDANAASEQGQFLNYEEAITVNERLFDHTHRTAGNQGNTTFRSTRLLGGTDSIAMYGLAKSLSVMPGDKITAKVFAKYVDATAPDVQQALLTFLTSLGTGGAGDPLIDGGLPGSLGGAIFPFPDYLDHENDDDRAPKVFLNYLVFDRDFNFLNGGYKPLTANARESGNLLPEGVGHDTLAFEDGEIKITEPGFVYIYFSNENESRVEVFFDDFEVSHTKSPVVEEEDYYPFGLAFNSYNRENSVPQDYKYNGKEEQNALNLGWLDYGARMYQPELGRFFTQDRFASKYFDYSPYSYGLNSPALYVDINGDSVWTTNKVARDKNGNTTVTHTVHVQGKVLNQSNGTTKAGDLAKGVNARLNAQGSSQTTKNDDGTTTTVVTKISANYTEAKSMNDVSKSDHLVVVVDGVLGGSDQKLGGGDASGLGQRPGKVSYIEPGSGAIETAFHEVGHNLGLPHPSVNSSSDPMSYMGTDANFSPAQMDVILNNAISGAPNQGSNYGIMRDHYPKVMQGTFYGTTNNTRPFQSAPSQNAKIPLPLNNGY